MLNKSKRLNTASFINIIEKGQSFHGPFLIIRAKKSDTKSRFAVSIPKKVAKTAVLRNKLKRRVFSIIKELELSLLPNFEVILIAKNGIDKLDFVELKSEITKIFVKIGILK